MSFRSKTEGFKRRGSVRRDSAAGDWSLQRSNSASDLAKGKVAQPESPDEPQEHALRRTSSWGSFKSVLRRSLRRDKDKGADVVTIGGVDGKERSDQAADATKGLFGGLFKNKKNKQKEGKVAGRQDDDARQAALGVLVTESPVKVKADFFKSKRGEHLWAARFADDEVTLQDVPIQQLSPAEISAMRR